MSGGGGGSGFRVRGLEFEEGLSLALSDHTTEDNFVVLLQATPKALPACRAGC